MSPILKSPQVDYGYDIADFEQVDEIFGTNEDLEELFREAKKLGIKVIMDFVIKNEGQYKRVGDNIAQFFSGTQPHFRSTRMVQKICC